ncbi:hypothetical protein MMC17_009189 [Xylographa soralifera]|nr:hypothetical protein [Xylographa soralifera]
MSSLFSPRPLSVLHKKLISSLLHKNQNKFLLDSTNTRSFLCSTNTKFLLGSQNTKSLLCSTKNKFLLYSTNTKFLLGSQNTKSLLCSTKNKFLVYSTKPKPKPHLTSPTSERCFVKDLGHNNLELRLVTMKQTKSSPEPERPNHERRHNSCKSVLVYDPARRTLGIKTEEDLKGRESIERTPPPCNTLSISQILILNAGVTNTFKQPVPRWASHVDVYVEEPDSEHDGSERRKSYVATVNLGKLGWSANVRRLTGEIGHLYLVDLPESAGSSETATTV